MDEQVVLEQLIKTDRFLEDSEHTPLDELSVLLPDDVSMARQWSGIVFPLSPPSFERLSSNLGEVIRRRSSQRDYDPEIPPEEHDLGLLLTLTAGKRAQVTAYGRREFPLFYSPSSGGLHGIDIYIFIKIPVGKFKQGVYYYNKNENTLIMLSHCYPDVLLSEAVASQPFAHEAPVVLAFVGDLRRGVWKYGARYYKFILVDAGVIAAQAHLIASGLGLKSCIIAGFDPQRIRRGLGLADWELPILLMTLGGSL